MGQIVVVVIEQTDRDEERYDISYTLPVGIPWDWSNCGRYNNMTGRRDYKTLPGAMRAAERMVKVWRQKAGWPR